MNTLTTSIVDQPAFPQNGRKGIAYDWQSLYYASDSEVAIDDHELTSLAITYS